MTDQTKREFLLLVVEKETTKCWSWVGEHDSDGRPIFRGDKAYRVMFRLRVGDIPEGFHVHHKCWNSACLNPRHLVALSPEAHSAVHATKDNALREQIYRGQWEQIQAAKAEAARLERARLEIELLQRERQRELARIEADRERLEKEKHLEREKLFDRLFPNLWNQRKLREQATKNDGDLNALRLALLRGELSHGHVQFFCDTYRGKDADLVSSLLQSRRPHPILIAGVQFKHFFLIGLFGALVVVAMTLLVLLVQVLLFRPDLMAAFFWALGILVLLVIRELVWPSK
jgi:hypothetical protein